MSSLRVLFSFPDMLGKSGIGAAALQHVHGLRAEGVDVLVACTSVAPGADTRGAQVWTTLTVMGGRVPHRALGVDRAYRYHDRRVARALEQGRVSADLVHCWPRATLETSAAARLLGIPVIREAPNTHMAHAYAVVAAEHEALGLPAPRGNSHTFDAATLALEEAEYAAADLLLVPSERAAETFRERRFASDRLAVHGYGIDPARCYPAASWSGGEGRPLTAVFAGRCEPRKGLHHALRAWHDSGLAETGRLVVLGEFVPGYRELLEPLLRHPSVECRGFVSNLEDVMREADLLVLPSVEEGSALVTYSAKGCGCVLVVSDAAGARCRHLEDAMVHAAGDTSSLTQHLRLLDLDRSLLARLREESLRDARTLTCAAAAVELREIYAALVARAADARNALSAGSPRSETAGMTSR